MRKLIAGSAAVLGLLVTTLPTVYAAHGETVAGAIVGGAAGAIIGGHFGGHDGAIVGGVIGGATGAVVGHHADEHYAGPGVIERHYGPPLPHYPPPMSLVYGPVFHEPGHGHSQWQEHGYRDWQGHGNRHGQEHGTRHGPWQGHWR